MLYEKKILVDIILDIIKKLVNKKSFRFGEVVFTANPYDTDIGKIAIFNKISK